jgi:tRNA threonylcarbamoyladenosine biosynthesis protein TsaE
MMPAGPLVIPTPKAMSDLGGRLAGVLEAGDLVLVSGPLGAGKTTFVRGLGSAMQVRGPVTSPTFVIARVHPSEVGGPALVHVDAYRLDGLAELDDLDLDTDLERAVIVVEWGTGVAEGLADSRLEVWITRAAMSEDRQVELLAFGDAWAARRPVLAQVATAS